LAFCNSISQVTSIAVDVNVRGLTAGQCCEVMAMLLLYSDSGMFKVACTAAAAPPPLPPPPAAAAAAGCAQVLLMEPHLHSCADGQGGGAQVGSLIISIVFVFAL
jgi:hypothetical protein